MIAQAENIHLNITHHFGFHLTQILQQGLDERKYKILRQLADAVVKGLISVFEAQLNIPPVFPQSQQADGDIRVMRSHTKSGLVTPVMMASGRQGRSTAIYVFMASGRSNAVRSIDS